MKNLLFIFSFLLLTYNVQSEGKDHIIFDYSTMGFTTLTGSGTLDINPLLNLNPCTGSGTIDLNFIQGATDMILWNDGSDDVKRVGLGSGEYAVDLLIDGCDTTIFFNLDFPDLLTAASANVTDKDCVHGTVQNPILGSFEVNVVGGESPYLYSLNNETPQTSNEFANLQEGSYTVDVTDANGCQTQIIQEIKCVGCRISGNPVSSGDEFFVDVFFGDNTETATLTVFNTNGRRVIGPLDVPMTNGEINGFPVTADLDPGMYVVLIVGDSISFSRQLIVTE